MGGWDRIQYVAGGGRPLVERPLLAEPHESLWERSSAVNALTGLYEPGSWLTPPDDVGLILRAGVGLDYLSLLRERIYTLVRVQDLYPWAIETDAGSARLPPTHRWPCDHYYPPGAASDPDTQVLDYRFLRSILTEALGGWWTDGDGGLAPLSSWHLKPKLPAWTAFAELRPVLDRLGFINDDRYQPWEDLGEEAIEANGAEWSTTRATAWSSLAADQGRDFFVGREGWGLVETDGDYRATVRHYWQRLLIDLGNVHDVLHADFSACAAERLVFYVYWRKGGPSWEGPSYATAASVQLRVKLSGDNGSTWETIYSGDLSLADSDWHCLKAVSTDPSRWTADSEIAIEYGGSATGDTPAWGAPNGGDTGWLELVELAYPRLYWSFAWDYAPA